MNQKNQDQQSFDPPAWMDPDGYQRAMDAIDSGDEKVALLWLSGVLGRFSMILTANADQIAASLRDDLKTSE
ncbi:MAG: hypothetical protein LAT64_02525 [Phycisphaerales bacterium]|nr:hypothetical protein [Planctomycetota bacterium]MCH8507633.1 hypothetical protein [Phycisphaerales bacterium]